MTHAWYRAYVGTCSDPKIGAVANRCGISKCKVIAMWHFILEQCCNARNGGRFKLDAHLVCGTLDVTVDEVKNIWGAMILQEMVTGDEVLAWKKRQYETDGYDQTNAERQSRWRKRHRNGIVTAPKQNITERKRPDTDTDTDNIYAQKLDLEFEKFWKDYPRRVSKQAALRSFKTARKSASFDSIMAGLAAAKLRDHRFSDEKFTPYPASWLNAGGYVDHEAQPEVETDLEYDDVLKTWKWKAGRQPAQN